MLKYSYCFQKVINHLKVIPGSFFLLLHFPIKSESKERHLKITNQLPVKITLSKVQFSLSSFFSSNSLNTIMHVLYIFCDVYRYLHLTNLDIFALYSWYRFLTIYVLNSHSHSHQKMFFYYFHHKQYNMSME